MKNSIKSFSWLLIATILPLLFASCSDDKDQVPTVIPTDGGTLTDKDGNEYHWVRIGKLDWMTENLRCGKPFYDDLDNERWYDDQWDESLLSLSGSLETRKKYYANFGNYYTWQEAVDNTPEGWRLPTDEDFKALERQLGMGEADLDKEGWRKGAAQLMTQRDEGTRLNFCYGGQICSFNGTIGYDLYHPYDYGYYWTASRTTVNHEDAAWCRMITPSLNSVKRLEILFAGHFLSVRYVRDAQ